MTTCEKHDELVERIAEIDARTKLIHDIVRRLEDRQQALALQLAKYGGVGVAIAAAGALIAKLAGVELAP